MLNQLDNNMRRLSRSPSIIPPPPLSKSPNGLPLPKKTIISSQCTIDTATLPASQIDSLARLNEEDVLREVRESLRAIEDYRNSLLKKREYSDLREQLRAKEVELRQKTKQLNELQEQVGRLKEVYARPKGPKGGRVPSLANQYSQQHLKVFTLAEELQKMKKHLQLHIDHHRNLKQKAKHLHNSIKELLPQYYELQVRRGLKPVSYGDFRKKAIADRNANKLKERLRIQSQRSLSIRSRSVSVRDIVDGSVLAPPTEKTLWHMQRKRSILSRARGASQKKFDCQARNLGEQLQFLRKEDDVLGRKIELLEAEANSLEMSMENSRTLKIRSENMLQAAE